jgi:hypothetical protein
LSQSYTDASPTAQELIGAIWKAYAAVADPATGQGVSDTSRYMVILHSKVLAFLYGNAQNLQSVEPLLPGRVVASPSVRSNLEAGTNESESWILIRDLLPIFSGEVRFLASQELANSLQVRFVARLPFATGFGKAPLSICRISGSGFTASL